MRQQKDNSALFRSRVRRKVKELFLVLLQELEQERQQGP